MPASLVDLKKTEAEAAEKNQTFERQTKEIAEEEKRPRANSARRS